MSINELNFDTHLKTTSDPIERGLVMSPFSILPNPKIVDLLAQPSDKETVWTVWWVAYSAESE